MRSIRPLLIGIACLCGASNLAAKAEAVDNGFYTTKDKEFYLSSDQILFIRPGLEIEILDVVIPADMQLEVTYSIKDPAGLPLDHEGIHAPGPTDMRFTLSNIPMGEEQKVTLASERIDSGNGTLTSLGDGVYKYKFQTVLASDADTTHTLVLGGRRDLREFGLDRYAANDIYNWVPSGLFDAVPRDVVTGETCNRCHDPITMHGRWLSPAACTQCHNPGLVADGMSFSFDTLIHQLHMGGALETPLVVGSHDYSKLVFPAEINDCEICHTGGTPTENFPLVANPKAVDVCDMSGLGTTQLSWGDIDEFEIHIDAADGPLFAGSSGAGSAQTGKWVKDGTVFFLVDKASGKTIQQLPVNATVLGCVGNKPGTFRGVAGAQHTNWTDHPSRRVCGSCHDGVNFATGEGHSPWNLVMPDDHLCRVCHRPETAYENDWSIRGEHLPLYKSAQFPGVLVKLIKVTNTNPGDHPSVTFSVASKTAPVDPASMDRLRFTLSGPNDDFVLRAQETVGTKAVKAGDNWTYTFEEAIPADAEGSYTVSFEARTLVDINLGLDINLDPEISEERNTAENTLLAFEVTDAVAKPRRTVVSDVKCENCHSNLALHGGARHDPDYCVTCHKPDFTAEVSVHFKYMIHSIHRGAALEKGYAVGSRVFDDVVFPGDLRNCDSCHVNNSQQLPLPAGLLPTATPQAWWDPMLPIASACLSCHDGDSAAVHAYSNTTFFGESCATCHGEGKEFAVDKVHAH
jgi:hypothetical protein